jgi:TfoX/Sxy family transcriptional regulator of competence genes
MAWTKAPQSLVDLFAESLPDDLRIERRKMFGYPAIFVGGNMCAGLFQDQMFARLAPADADALPGGAQLFEPMPGRPMKGYALIPDDILADEERLTQTLAKAVAFTAAMPPKEKKVKPKRA